MGLRFLIASQEPTWRQHQTLSNSVTGSRWVVEVNLLRAAAGRRTRDLGPKGDGRYECVTCVSELTVLKWRN